LPTGRRRYASTSPHDQSAPAALPRPYTHIVRYHNPRRGKNFLIKLFHAAHNNSTTTRRRRNDHADHVNNYDLPPWFLRPVVVGAGVQLSSVPSLLLLSDKALLSSGRPLLV